MEEDDEFGDLYTDVLGPFPPSSTPLNPSRGRTSYPPVVDLNFKYGRDKALVSDADAVKKVPGLVSDSQQSDGDKMEQELRFDIEDGNNGVPDDSMPLIAGLGEGAGHVWDSSATGADVEDDEDSESEDDLQIVLNDTSTGARTAARRNESDDEDGGPLVIVADGNPSKGIIEEQDWGMGDDASAGGNPAVDRREGTEKSTGLSSGIPGLKIGYNSHGYHHPFHSQFKYVRPGAAPLPGSTPNTSGQVRPQLGMSLGSGRGKGDWRPGGNKNALPLQKGYNSGFGTPSWSNNTAGRGFGGGLDFTLPSYKTIFDVDVDSFEEKPWKYASVDISDFFNFDLNEESWKEYCKQLSQHRLETTMQSKIRVYEIGRGEQDYDPDMPPELVAAAGLHDVISENAGAGKFDTNHMDSVKGSVLLRQLPTGRAIQVETGSGDRLPSIDSRPPRVRDCDAVIEIICQESLEPEMSHSNSDGNEENYSPQYDEMKNNQAEESMAKVSEFSGNDPRSYNDHKGRHNSLYLERGCNNLNDGGKVVEQCNTTNHWSDLKVPKPSRSSVRDINASRTERSGSGPPVEERVANLSPNRCLEETRVHNEGKDIEKTDAIRSPSRSPPTVLKGDSALSSDEKVVSDSRTNLADESLALERNDQSMAKDVDRPIAPRKHGAGSYTEQNDGLDDDDSKAARSSENSRARSGSSRSLQHLQDCAEEEVDGRRAAHSSNLRKEMKEHDMNHQRKDRDVRLPMDNKFRNVSKRDDPYLASREVDSSSLHSKNEGYDRRKEHDVTDVRKRRVEDTMSRKNRSEDIRRKDRRDDMGSRITSKGREADRNDQEELHSRKYGDNGSLRDGYDKDGLPWHRDREESVKVRYDATDMNRRKDEEYMRREHGEEDMLHGSWDSGTRRRREWDDTMDARKRNDQSRVRDGVDNYHLPRPKEVRERDHSDRHRDREDSYRLKQGNDENVSRHDREDSRASARNGRGSDDKGLTGVKKDESREGRMKDGSRNSEIKKRGRMDDDDNPSHHRGRDDHAQGSQSGDVNKKPRLDKFNTTEASDKQRWSDKKGKESSRKHSDYEGSRDNSVPSLPRKVKDLSRGHTDEKVPKSRNERGDAEKEPRQQRNSSKRPKEASSDEEQDNSKRGRSKLERWTSQKERNYTGDVKSTSSNLKESDKNEKTGRGAGETSQDATPHIVPKDPVLVETKEGEAKQVEDRHLDTVEKLKKRSERFKLPMPGEKDTAGLKKTDNEMLPSAPTENPSEKPERPARKRRWISK